MKPAVCLAVDGFYPMGGTERQVVELAHELRRRMIPVTLLSRWPLELTNAYVRELRDADIEIIASGWRGRRGGRLRRISYLWARVRAGKADELAVEQRLWRWQARQIKKLARPGLVLHELPFFGVISPAGRRTLRALKTPLVLTALGRMEGIVPVIDVPWAVVTADGQPVFDPADTSVSWIPSMGSRQLLGLQRRPAKRAERTIVYGGRLVRGKGLDVLVRAVAGLPDNVQLVIAGYGPERPALERLARATGASVRFTGPLDATELLALLAAADIAALPAIEGEGMPSFVVEALGAGVPVVASDVGTISRALSDGGGILVPPGDVALLRARITQLLDGDLEPSRRAARRTFERRFSPPTVVDAYVRAYEQALAHPALLRPDALTRPTSTAIRASAAR